MKGSADSVFHSDDSTLVDSSPDLESYSSSLPPNNYLWASPHGHALPGWHHQLILHLLSLDESWMWKPELGFSMIRMWLKDFFPAYIVGEPVIRAVAVEYQELDEDLKSAYRGMAPLFSSWPRRRWHIDGPAASVANWDIRTESTSEGLNDPALFVRASPPTAADVGQGHNREHATKHVPNSFVAAPEAEFLAGSLSNNQAVEVTNAFTQSAIAPRDSDNARTSAHHRKFTTIFHLPRSEPASIDENDTTPPSTPLGKTTIPCSPNTPKAKRNMPSPSEMNAMTSEHPSPTPMKDVEPKNSSEGPSVDDEVKINERNAKLYAPLYLKVLVDSRYQPSQPKHSEHKQADDKNVEQSSFSEEGPSPKSSQATGFSDQKPSIPTVSTVKPLSEIANGSSKTNLPKPDPTKYKQTSKNHWKILQSEADKFIAHFNPAVDPLPDCIEGYFWYCEKCYHPQQAKSTATISASENAPTQEQEADGPRKRRKVVTGGHTKGRFSVKRSVEKHMQDVHRLSWKCNTLPEPERGKGGTVPSSLSMFRADIDTQDSRSERSRLQNVESSSPRELVSELNEAKDPAMSTPNSVQRKLFQEEIAKPRSELKDSGVEQEA